MIRSIQVSAYGTDNETLYEPPERILEVAVIGTNAHLTLYTTTAYGIPKPESDASIVVPARSLLLAVHAGIHDNNSDQEQP